MDFKSGQKDYKSGQGFQIRAKKFQIAVEVTNQGRVSNRCKTNITDRMVASKESRQSLTRLMSQQILCTWLYTISVYCLSPSLHLLFIECLKDILNDTFNSLGQSINSSCFCELQISARQNKVQGKTFSLSAISLPEETATASIDNFINALKMTKEETNNNV